MPEVFVFSAKKQLTENEKQEILSLFNEFSKIWKSHGDEVISNANWIHDYFFYVEIKSPNELSGCSKDDLFRCIQEIDKRYACELMNHSKIPVRRNDGTFTFLSTTELKNFLLMHQDELDDVYIYNTSVRDSTSFNSDFIKPIKKSWAYQKYLGRG